MVSKRVRLSYKVRYHWPNTAGFVTAYRWQYFGPGKGHGTWPPTRQCGESSSWKSGVFWLSGCICGQMAYVCRRHNQYCYCDSFFLYCLFEFEGERREWRWERLCVFVEKKKNFQFSKLNWFKMQHYMKKTVFVVRIHRFYICVCYTFRMKLKSKIMSKKSFLHSIIFKSKKDFLF